MASTVTVNILGDASNLRAALGQAGGALDGFQSKLKSFGDSAVSLGKSLTLGLTAPIAALGALSFNELAQAGKVAAQTAAAIKSTGGAANVTAQQIDQLGSSLLRKTGIDDEAIKSGANLLLTFTRIRNETGKGNDIFNQATKAALNLSVAFGKDMTDSAILVGKALQDPILGVTALRRVGVQLSDEQQKQIQNFVALGDIMGAQKIILGELTTEVGGSAAAYGKTMAGQVSKAKEELLNAGAAMVSVAAPAVKFLADQVQSFAHWLESLGEGTKTAVGGVLLFAAALGPVVFLVGKVAQGISALVVFAGAIASVMETGALKVLYLADALKAMTAAQLLATAAPFAIVAGIVAIGYAVDRYIWPADAALKSLAESFAKGEAQGKRWAAIQIAASTSAADAITFLKSRIVDLKGESAALEDQFSKGSVSNDAYVETFKRNEAASAALKTELAKLKLVHAETAAAAAAHDVEMRKLANGTTDYMTTTDEALSATREFHNALLAISGGDIGYQQALLNITQAEKDLADAQREHPDDLDLIREKELAVMSARLNAAGAADTLTTSNEDLFRKLKEEGLPAYNAELLKLKERIAQYPALAGVYQDQITKLDGVWYAVNSIPADKTVTVTADVQQALDALDAVTRSVKGIPGLAFIGSANTAIGNIVEGRAAGGPVMGGTPYIVGEHGPELFVPRSSGSIVPSGSGAGGWNGTLEFPIIIGGTKVAHIVASEFNRKGGPKISQHAIV